MKETATLWCGIDAAPAHICNGPHVAHLCPNGDLVTVRFDQADQPCPGCGENFLPAQGGSDV